MITQTETSGITLSLLQTRRSIALQDDDMAAYWAFDLLIGHVVGEADMYVRHNQAIDVAKADSMDRYLAAQEAEQVNAAADAQRLIDERDEAATVAAYVEEGLGEWTDFCHADDAARERQS